MDEKKIQKITEKVEELLEEAAAIQRMNGGVALSEAYGKWYARAMRLVQANIPEQEEAFLALYSAEETTEFIVKGWVGSSPSQRGFFAALANQIGIVAAIPDAIAIRALDLRGLVTADLLDSELDAAQVLVDNGFIRAAGAVAGVVAEGHLKLLHDQVSLSYNKKEGIYKLAERLKAKGFISQADERRFQAVADTRNDCDHKNPVEPTNDDVQRMIRDVNQLIKRVQVL